MSSVKNTRILLTRLGDRSGMQVVHDTVGDPPPGQVRIKVLVSGLSQADITIRHGMYPESAPLPFTLGYDLVGVIDQLGEGVTGWRVGDRVAAITVRGANTRYLSWPANDLTLVPEGLSDDVAVSLILNGVTAYQVLHRHAHLQKGQRVLVQSAAGGVGSLLCELAVHAGAQVVGTASPRKHELVRSLGASPIDYRKPDRVAQIRALTDGGVDIAVDGVGGTSYSDSYAALRRGGRFVAIGFSAELTRRFGRLGTFARMARMMVTPDGKKVGFYGIMFLKRDHPDWFTQDLSTLFQLALAGTLKPRIFAKMPLEECSKAHELLEAGEVAGKIVLVS